MEQKRINKILKFYFAQHRIRQTALKIVYFFISNEPLKLSDLNMSEFKAIGLSEEGTNTSSVRAEDVTGEIKAKESQSLTFNVGLSDTGVVENTKIAVQEHTIFVGGTELSDRKEWETVQIPGVGKISTLRHTRKMSDQQYTLIEKSVNNQVRKT